MRVPRLLFPCVLCALALTASDGAEDFARLDADRGPQAHPASGGEYAISITGQSGTVETDNGGTETLRPDARTLSITGRHRDGYQTIVSTASIATDFSPAHVEASASTEVEPTLWNPGSSAYAEVSIEFDVPFETPYARTFEIYNSTLFGVPVTPWILLTRDGTTLWSISSGLLNPIVNDTCTHPLPPPECWVLPAGHYTLTVLAESHGSGCNGCSPVTNARIRLSFADCIDPDEDGVCLDDDNCAHTANPDQADVDQDGIGDACDSCSSADADGDGLCDPVDNCPMTANPGQADADGDGAGDACDNCLDTVNADQSDQDADGVGDACDLCPFAADADQTDEDLDGVGDACDDCPGVPNADQSDVDQDGTGDACDSCPAVAGPQDDADRDGLGAPCDNCPSDANPDQADGDADGFGDACDVCPQTVDPDQADADDDHLGDLCDPDADDDGLANEADDCPLAFDPGQQDLDGDQLGDACDPDVDGDQIANPSDNCPGVANPDQRDVDGDGVGDLCDACPDEPGTDDDQDGWCDASDNCPDTSNPGQEDLDGDGSGDACDADVDGDGYDDASDNCPRVPNDQRDDDGDGLGNACDVCPDDPSDDDDGDGLCGAEDNCPLVWNAAQTDLDGDGFGDVCDVCPTEPPVSDAIPVGNVCDSCPADPLDPDGDGDGLADFCDNCPTVVNCNAWGEPVEGVQPDSTWLRLGSAMALSTDGTTALVAGDSGGCNGTCGGESGRAYLFSPGGDGWSGRVEAAPATSEAEFFGSAVALSAAGDVALVGARGYTSNGLVYEFRRVGSVWNKGEILEPIGVVIRARFGAAVALSADGNTAVIGAPGDRTAHIYSWEADQWTREAVLSTNAPTDFGQSVAISADGTIVVVGDPGWSGTAYDAGAVYVFRDHGTGWVEETRLSVAASNPNALFGESVAISTDGRTIVIGASGVNAAYVYRYGGSGWVFEQTLTQTPDDPGLFGRAVAISPDGARVVVGAPLSDGTVEYGGAAYLFRYDGTTWLRQEKFVANDGSPDDDMGSAVAVSSYGRLVLVGAESHTHQDYHSGAIYSFEDRCRADTDDDGFGDACDNCPEVDNPDQADLDSDGLGDKCDNCPSGFNPAQEDRDGDGLGDVCDPCALADHTCCGTGTDTDADGVVNSCDNCRDLANADQSDLDDDGVGDACDPCPLDPYDDYDGDGVCGDIDNCPMTTPNPDQTDSDGDGVGDACDTCALPPPYDADLDLDGVCDVQDNCPGECTAEEPIVCPTSNPNQQDRDGDGVGDACDNCPSVPDATQADADGDDIGDACDRCPADRMNDVDEDGWCAPDDNCPLEFNPDQTDTDGDGVGDVCDVCPTDRTNPDSDADGICDDVDNCAGWPNLDQGDVDDDGLGNACDNCPLLATADQSDTDGDGLGDACDVCPTDPGNDPDGDAVCAAIDNCPGVSNPSQTDADGDGLGDACDICPNDPDDVDPDGDAVCGVADNCPLIANPAQTDADGDGLGDACDPCPEDPTNDDADGDAVCDGVDNCPLLVNPAQTDTDGDGLGDACDPCPEDPTNEDSDGDGVCERFDNCPGLRNPGQSNGDGDAWGDVCDNCPGTAQSDQADVDRDGTGDACDNCPSVSNPDQANGDRVLEIRWAAFATASSAWTDTADWSAEQATGPADLNGCSSAVTNWSPLTGGGDPEWLELTYPIAAGVSGVDIYESGLEAGFVERVELEDVTGQRHTVWEGADPSACGEPLVLRWLPRNYDTRRVVVHTRTDGWEEIDAVALQNLGEAAPDPAGNACDVCPFIEDPGQADSDGDGSGDACDCAPDDASTRPAAEVSGVSAVRPAPGVVRFSWPAAIGADGYAVIRATLSEMRAGSFGRCVAPTVMDNSYEDDETPGPGEGFTYLIRGVDSVCGLGTLGAGVGGFERRDSESTACVGGLAAE